MAAPVAVKAKPAAMTAEEKTAALARLGLTANALDPRPPTTVYLAGLALIGSCWLFGRRWRRRG